VDNSPETFDDYIRILEIKNITTDRALGAALAFAGGNQSSEGSALVHWWYYPDSYNEWLPASEINISDPPDLTSLYTPTRSKWYVCCRFILDCEVFNEWGNPMDYENENESPEDQLMSILASAEEADLSYHSSEQSKGSGSSKRTRGKKQRFGQVVTGSKDKEKIAPTKLILWVPGIAVGTEKLMPDLIPTSLKESGEYRVLEITGAGFEDCSLQNVILNASDAVTGTKRKFDESESVISDVALDTDTIKPAWFSSSSVSKFEERMLGLQSSPANVTSEYLKLRNSIISMCEQSPIHYITATECRRKLSGDVGRILRIHEFLNAFGLINKAARKEARPAFIASQWIAAKPEYEGITMEESEPIDDSKAEFDSALLKYVEQQNVQCKGDFKSFNWELIAKQIGNCSASDCASRLLEISLDAGNMSNSSLRIDSDTYQSRTTIAPNADNLLTALRLIRTVGSLNLFLSLSVL
jgi:hypothetical protein